MSHYSVMKWLNKLANLVTKQKPVYIAITGVVVVGVCAFIGVSYARYYESKKGNEYTDQKPYENPIVQELEQEKEKPKKNTDNSQPTSSNPGTTPIPQTSSTYTPPKLDYCIQERNISSQAQKDIAASKQVDIQSVLSWIELYKQTGTPSVNTINNRINEINSAEGTGFMSLYYADLEISKSYQKYGCPITLVQPTPLSHYSGGSTWGR